MPIYPRGKVFQVQVTRASAKEGFRRIRRDCPTWDGAVALEQEIGQAIDKYGKWPVEAGDIPLVSIAPTLPTGTLREAAELALETHWKGTAYYQQVEPVVNLIVTFMERERKKRDLDDLTSEDLDAYIRYCFEERNASANTVNHHLSALSVINATALERKPPLCTGRLPIKRVKVKRLEKWWLRPEDQERAVKWLHGQAEFVFADYLETLAYQGLRVAEGLRLRERHITGLGGSTPRLKVPGTKTEKSEQSIPVFPQAVPILERSIERANKLGWGLLFPMTWRQANGTWQQVRSYLGVEDIKTATLQAVRRSFAHYANERGMPTKTLQQVLRHETISTTDKYLQLVGGTDAESARRYFETGPSVVTVETVREAVDFGPAIAAYVAAGATPDQVAQFVKELMK